MSFNTKGKRSMIIGPGLPIIIDSVNSETHTSAVRFTRYPVESGRLFSDHAQEQPDQLELNILITDTPLTDGKSSYEGRYRAIYSQLRLWQKFKAEILITLGLRSYTSMYLEEMIISKQPTDGKSIRATLKFIEVPRATQTLYELAANLLVDSSIVHTATDLIPIGII